MYTSKHFLKRLTAMCVLMCHELVISCEFTHIVCVTSS